MRSHFQSWGALSEIGTLNVGTMTMYERWLPATKLCDLMRKATLWAAEPEWVWKMAAIWRLLPTSQESNQNWIEWSFPVICFWEYFKMAPQVRPKCFWHGQYIINNRRLKKWGYLIKFGHMEAVLKKVIKSQNYRAAEIDPIPHICPVWYTTTLFRPVKSTPKSM